MKSNAIVWIRDDFRLNDNSALSYATSKHNFVSVLYIFNKENFDGKREAQKWWISKSLESLAFDLQKLNINLEIEFSEELKFFKKFNKENISVYWNKVYEPYHLDLDREIIKNFEDKKINYKFFKGNILNEYQSITKKDGTPFKVFSPFWRHAEEVYLNKIPTKILSLRKMTSKINIISSKYKPKDLLPKKKLV